MKIQEANEILRVVSENKIVLSEKDTKRVAKARSTFISHYKDKPKRFIEDFTRIIDGSTNIEIPFKLNAAQGLVIDSLASGNRFIAAPKARQLGLTTLSNALALHHSIFTGNANVVCMAVKTDNAIENLRRIRTMFKTMPEWVQSLLIEFDKERHFSNQSEWSFFSKITQTENKLEVVSAGSEDSTRGKTPTFLHWTEVAFADRAKQVYTSVSPAIDRRNDSIVILESTGNGNAGFYYEVCTGVRSGFDVIFLPWFLEEEYTLDGDELTEADRIYISDLMGVKELPENLTDGQIRWFRAKSEKIGKADCQQEYPISVEQVFQATNSSFFNWKTMQKIRSIPPKFYMAYENGFLTQRPIGPGCFYDNVKSEYEYLISCDPSAGIIDYTSIGVYDPDGNEVAHWHEKREAEDVAELLNALGKHFNNARVVVEANGIGSAVLNSLIYHKFYPNVHREAGKLGFPMTSKDIKNPCLSHLQTMLNTDELTINNQVIVQEMSIFEAEALKATKGDGNHDDCVIQAAIAAFVFKHNPPKKKYIRNEWADYSYATGGKKRTKRRFIF